MQFKVPQFIDQDAKIFGPLTFKQFIVVGSGGAVCLVLFFVLAGNFFLWFMISSVIIGTTLALIFVKVQGVTLISFIAKSISFSMKPKRYFWEKKLFPMKISIKKPEIEPLSLSSVKKETHLKTAKGSRINKLSSEIEYK